MFQVVLEVFGVDLEREKSGKESKHGVPRRQFGTRIVRKIDFICRVLEC